MLRMCVCMHSRFVENHPIWILEDGPLISDVVLSQSTACPAPGALLAPSDRAACWLAPPGGPPPPPHAPASR
jgi:hypothetical protein